MIGEFNDFLHGDHDVMAGPEHIGMKINKAITYVLLVTCASLLLVAGYYFLKVALS